MNFLKVDNSIGIPKYKQILDSIEKAIVNGEIKKGDKLPSLNAIKDIHKVSRDTVLMAFNELKNRGIIHSIVGKGYYISSEDVKVSQKVLLLFDELNGFKEDLYNAFLDNLDSNIQVDIYFHHFNTKVFHQIITDNISNYSYYVIMPANLEKSQATISLLPKDKVYILDQMHDEHLIYPAVFQNFNNDVFEKLSEIKDKLLKYDKFKLVFNPEKQPQGILKGFIRFCRKYKISYQIKENLDANDPEQGTAYMVMEDKHLIRFIKKMKENGFQFILDVGLISYNESLLKEVIGEGITTISTDFKAMGKQLAEMITHQSHEHIENESKISIRKSI